MESKMTTSSGETKMATRTRFELGLMAGVVASVVMGLAIIVVTALGSLIGYPWQIQFFVWLGSIFGASGSSVYLAEVGVVLFVVLSIISGLIFAFAFRAYDIYEGLVLGGIALLFVGIYLTLETAPQLSGTLLTMSLDTSLGLILPLALCFALWGLTIGYFGERYLQ
jgi:hypothetical protein